VQIGCDGPTAWPIYFNTFDAARTHARTHACTQPHTQLTRTLTTTTRSTHTQARTHARTRKHTLSRAQKQQASRRLHAETNARAHGDTLAWSTAPTGAQMNGDGTQADYSDDPALIKEVVAETGDAVIFRGRHSDPRPRATRGNRTSERGMRRATPRCVATLVRRAMWCPSAGRPQWLQAEVALAALDAGRLEELRGAAAALRRDGLRCAFGMPKWDWT
jgi:hypothetical protein